jgi:RNA polymerase sigma-70 factor (ECF subfamily)
MASVPTKVRKTADGGVEPAPVSDLEQGLAELSGEVVAFMQHHCGDPHLGADLAHDALAQAMRHLQTLRDPRALRGWVFKIAINRFNDHLRRGVLEPQDAASLPDRPAPPHLAPDREMLARELDAVLRQELHRLPDRQRTVLMLHGVRDLDQVEIAALLGISVDAVKMSLFHAREKMRVRLARYLDRVPEKRRMKPGLKGRGR